MRAFLRLAVLSLALLGGHAAYGQASLLQGGPWTPGHAAVYGGSGSSQPIVQDGGAALGGPIGSGMSELLLQERGVGAPPYANAGTGPYGTNVCDYDAYATSAAGYHYLCFGPNAQGAALLVAGAVGAAPQLPLEWIVNGIAYQFPFTSGGIVGPSTTVVGDFALWANTAGSLLKDAPPPAAAGATPSNPTGTTATTAVMMGLALSITPDISGIVHVAVAQDCTNSVSGSGGQYRIYIGTGTAPANGAALTGTAIGSQIRFSVAANGQLLPCSATALISSLTVGTTYWIDEALNVTTSGTAALGDVSAVATELP